MKRTPLKRAGHLKRGKPLRSGGRLERRTRLKARKTSKRFAKRRDPAWCAWIRTLPCCVPVPSVATIVERDMNRRRPRLIWCWPDTQMVAAMNLGIPVAECAHVRSRGAGGDDRGNTVPLCKRHHAQQHAIGIDSFQSLYGVNLAKIAAELAA